MFVLCGFVFTVSIWNAFIIVSAHSELLDSPIGELMLPSYGGCDTVHFSVFRVTVYFTLYRLHLINAIFCHLCITASTFLFIFLWSLFRSWCLSRENCYRRWRCGFRSTGTSQTSWPSSYSLSAWCCVSRSHRSWVMDGWFTVSTSSIGTSGCSTSSESTSTWVPMWWWSARWWEEAGEVSSVCLSIPLIICSIFHIFLPLSGLHFYLFTLWLCPAWSILTVTAYWVWWLQRFNL